MSSLKDEIFGDPVGRDLRRRQESERKAQEDALRAQGRFEEVLAMKDAELEEVRAGFKRAVKVHGLRAALEAAGVIDADVVALANLDKISVDEDYNVTGAREEVDMIKKAHPRLFGPLAKPIPPPKVYGR